MEEIQLGCAMFGEDEQFVVRIPHDADVAELQEAIGAEMLSRDDPIKPSMLKLYLARKDDAWVKMDAYSELAELSGDVVDPEFKVMKPLRNVSDYLVKVDPKNDKGGVVHVIVKRPPPLRIDEEPPAKRQHVEQDVTLQDLWPRIEWKLDKLPAANALQALLQKPLPFRLEDDPQAALHCVFQSDAQVIECSALQSQMTAFFKVCDRPPDSHASENSWQNVYAPLIKITIDLLSAHDVNITTNRNRVDVSGSTKKLLRPDFLLICEGLVFLRGEEKNANTPVEESLTELTSKMNPWSPVVYANLRYILGYATSGSTLQLVAIEKDGVSLRKTVIAVLKNIVNDRAGAVKVFVNLALLVNEMLRFVDLPSQDRARFKLDEDDMMITERSGCRQLPSCGQSSPLATRSSDSATCIRLSKMLSVQGICKR